MKFLLFLGSITVAFAQQGGQADSTDGITEYHYSWLHDGKKEYAQPDAIAYCKNLGGGRAPVSVETAEKNALINAIITFYRLKYIWTGGVKTEAGWTWPSGTTFKHLNWSHTGGLQKPQPDNREGNENCLAILNNFYQDGIKWHDVACHHVKAIICERSA